MTTRPWDRLPDETDAQYAQFLVFRDLGPSRTLARAYRQYLKHFDTTPGARKGPSGAFKETAAARRWRERAEAWDVWRLLTYGARIAPLYVAAVEQMTKKLLAASQRIRPGQKGWRDVLDTLGAISAQLEVAKRAGAGGESTDDKRVFVHLPAKTPVPDGDDPGADDADPATVE